MNRYDRLESEFLAGGGYAAEAEAAAICSNLALPDRLLNQPLKTLSGGQRRRVELARILYSDAETMLLDEPTNHLDADSIAWLRDFLKNHQGGLIVISHDTELLEATVNKVFLLDANRAQIDFYNMDWKRYLTQRETDERARKRERANAEKKAQVLIDQANKMRAKATKAVAAQNMAKRAERLLERPGGRARERPRGRPALPGSVTLRQDPAHRGGPQQVLRFAGNLHRRGPRHRPRLQGGHPGPQRCRQDHPAAHARRRGQARYRRIIAGHGLKVGYYAQEHETLDVDRTVLENMRSSAPDMKDAEVRGILGSFLFSGDDVDKPAGVLSGGEKTRLALATIVASSANVLLLDEPTNNLDPASRAEILGALKQLQRRRRPGQPRRRCRVEALNPERVVLLPDGVEDHWNEDYLDLITLA